MKTLLDLIKRAIERRKSMALVSDALRLVNGSGDGLEGLLIDRYNRHVQVQVLTPAWLKAQEDIVKLISTLMPIDYLIIKARQGLKVESRVVLDGDPKTIVEEHGLKFEVHLNDGLNCGLFADMRANRHRIGQEAGGKKVLNCFSYTCSFGVHARGAGAREVVNIDISRKVLDRGRQNYALNGLAPDQGEFIKADTLSYLQRALKKNNLFDIVIMDPPSFARHEGKAFQVKRDLPKALALGVAVLNPGGMLLVTTNYSELSHADLERMLSQGLNGRRVSSLLRVGQDKDFCGSNSFKESYLVGLWGRFH